MIIRSYEYDEGRPSFFFFLISFYFFQQVLLPRPLHYAPYTLITPVLLISHCFYIWFSPSYLRGASYVRQYLLIFVPLKAVFYVTTILFVCKTIILAKFSSLITAEVCTYACNFGADYMTLRVAIIHLTSGGIWINLNLSQQAMKG